MLLFAETLTLVPAEATIELTEEAKEVFNDLDRAFVDTILSARGNDRILLCDDRPFRALAIEAAQIKSVWTQTAVGAAANKTISPQEYFRTSNILAEAKYFYTSLSAGNLFYAWEESNWSVTPTLRTLLDLLARPTNTPRGVINVLGNSAQIAWAQKLDSKQFKTLFVAIFVAFKQAQPECDLQGLADLASARVMQFVRSRLDRAFQDLLRQSTYMTPVGNIVAEVHAIEERTAARVRIALDWALQKART